MEKEIKICFAFLLTEGYEYSCDKNVPGNEKDHESVRGTLLEAINRVRREIGGEHDLVYDCSLAKDAFEQTYTENGEEQVKAYTNFNGESIFNYNWKESLERAVENAKQNSEYGIPMSILPSFVRVGCAIRLSTSEEDGEHQLKLQCNYDTRKNEKK